MKAAEVTKIIQDLGNTKDRNLVIIDYGNVDKWRNNLGWKIGIRELGNLVRSIAQGNQQLRRFYFGSDYSQDIQSATLRPFSNGILVKAQMSKFEIITKPVKYIHDLNYTSGFLKKCNFDVERTVDAIKEVDRYDTIIIFSGDGAGNAESGGYGGIRKPSRSVSSGTVRHCCRCRPRRMRPARSAPRWSVHCRWCVNVDGRFTVRGGNRSDVRGNHRKNPMIERAYLAEFDNHRKAIALCCLPRVE
ncbi:MAG TPA: hypothetical protein VFK06_00880 [Candidatus Angelobacter sp.]|nr:hypothetical protein [Candidatus Angelobacter sp.]